MGTGTYNTTQNKFAQKTKSPESEFHTQENLLQSKNQKSNKVEKEYSTSSTITQQKITVDSDASVGTNTIPYQNNSINSNNNYRSDDVNNNIDTEWEESDISSKQ